jgi:periplasmic protein TonB
MSYTDIDRPTLQPGGVIAAVLINGGAVLAILFAGSTIVEKIVDKPIKTLWFDQPRTKPVEIKREDKRNETKDTTLTSEKRVDDQRREVSKTVLTGGETATGGDETGTAGDFVEPKADPIPIPTPFIKAARIDPRYAGALQPEYPPSMIRAEQSGNVTVRVKIGTDGRVKDVQIISSASNEFAEATKRQALRKWRFVPATRDGQPEESWREMTVKFEMPS